MRNCQLFRGSPTWHPILLGSDDDKLRAYSDPAVRRKLHEEVVEWRADMQRAGFARNWYDYMWVEAPVLEQCPSCAGWALGNRRGAHDYGTLRQCHPYPSP
jgi:hypothetical protein